MKVVINLDPARRNLRLIRFYAMITPVLMPRQERPPPQKKERERKWRKRKNVCGGYDVRLDYWILCILISKVRSSSNP